MNKAKMPFGGKLYVKHGALDTPQLARDYLISLGANREAIDRLFDKDGEWKYTVEREFDPFTYTASQLERTLLKDLAPVYNLVNQSLDGIYETGFNKHDLDHIVDVTNEVHRLLTEAGVDQRTIIIGILASVAHDLGNILSRKSHSKLSPMLFKHIFPNIVINKKDWLRVKESIMYHDEGVIFPEIETWKTNRPLANIKMFRKSFKPETLALLIADKTRVSRERLSSKPTSADVINDVYSGLHIEVNLLGQSESIVIKKNSATVTFHYRPFANAQEAEAYPHFFKPTKGGRGFRASVSEQTRKLHEFETPIDHFSVWRHQYWKVYSERTILYIYSLFALFPHIDFVKIKMVDFISPASESFEEVEYKVNKRELYHFEKFVKAKYLK